MLSSRAPQRLSGAACSRSETLSEGAVVQDTVYRGLRGIGQRMGWSPPTVYRRIIRDGFPAWRYALPVNGHLRRRAGWETSEAMIRVWRLILARAAREDLRGTKTWERMSAGKPQMRPPTRRKQAGNGEDGRQPVAPQTPATPPDVVFDAPRHIISASSQLADALESTS